MVAGNVTEAIREEYAAVDNQAKSFDGMARWRSTGHTVLIFAAALAPAATALAAQLGTLGAGLAGIIGTAAVVGAHNFDLRAHAECKWQTAMELRLLRNALGELSRRDDDGTLEAELQGCGSTREQILANDRTRMSKITPRELRDAALKDLGVDKNARKTAV
jgi:hypothetical protein